MAKRPTRKAKSETASKLAEAMNFIGPATSEGGEPFEAHCRIAGKTVMATDGIFSAGHAVEEEFALCPHAGRLIDALNRAGSSLGFVESPNGTLLVKGDKIRATVPCIPGDSIPPIMPDPNIAVIDDRIKDGFAKLLPLIDHEGDRVVEVSILLQANSMFATNGFILFEYWHGVDLPPGLVLPKTFAKAVAGCAKKLAGFGFSPRSVTFYFEDGSWYKTQQYGEPWPNVEKLFSYPHFPAAVPEGLFEAVKAIESYSADGLVHFHAEKLKSTYTTYQDRNGVVYGATYDVPGLQEGHSFTARLLRTIEPVCALLDYTSNDDRAFFVDGGNLRGSIMKCGFKKEPAGEPVYALAGTTSAMEGHDADGLPTVQEAAPAPARNAWGQPIAPEPAQAPAVPAGDPANPWAGIVGTGYEVEDDDIPF